MAAPTVTALPDMPLRGEPKEQYATKCNDAMNALPGMVTEINTLGTWMNDTAADVETDAAAAEAAKVAAEAAAAAGEGYETVTIALDGSFSGGSVKIVRVGDSITITSIGVTHASSNSAVTSTGFIPTQYRPIANTGSVTYMDTTLTERVRVGTNGILSLNHYNSDDGTDINTVGSQGFSVSYCRADQP